MIDGAFSASTSRNIPAVAGQQLRQAFPYEPPVRFLLLDCDSKYSIEVPAAIRCMSISPVRTVVGCPWQNGVAERWVGSCRRELPDHFILINQSHLKRLLAAYVEYYHRIAFIAHLQKQTPIARTRCAGSGKVGRVAPSCGAFTTGMNAQFDGS